MKRTRGFTLIELLVVVAIIGVLIAILLPSLGRVKESARRTVCATNLKSQGNALAVYAQQFNDFLPAFSNGSGYWLHDEPLEFSETLLNTPSAMANNLNASSIRKWFYCPSNYNSNDDALWDYGPQHGLQYRAQGYSYLNDRRAAGGAGNYPGLPFRAAPKLAYRSKMVSTNNAADCELVLDEILSPDSAGYNSQFSVTPPPNGAPAGTSHLQGAKPAGANVLAYDGHVAWRKFPTGTNNGILPVTLASNAYAWIINPY